MDGSAIVLIIFTFLMLYALYGDKLDSSKKKH